MTRGLDARIVVDRGGFTLGVNLSIEPGQTIALLGPNGAGKSTVVAALAGLLPLAGGQIELDGVVLDDPAEGVFKPPEEREIGVVFQDYVLFPHMTVLDNVAFGLRARNMKIPAAREVAGEWLQRLGIEELGGLKPPDLSGGQAQRVALARALITEPRLLLLDEPLAALDISTRSDLRRVLDQHLADFAGPRLLITHDPTEAFLLADEVVVIEGGSITQQGSAADIRMRPRTPYVADLAGSNLLVGTAEAGEIDLGEVNLRIADTAIGGDVVATIHPRAISIHRQRPEGSPRNAWETSVSRIEHYGDRVRLETGDPLLLAVEITPGALTSLGLGEGSDIWVSIKATEIGVQLG